LPSHAVGNFLILYNETEMRRALSILQILVFVLAPLAAALPASEDSGLPPCCRRHGAHHCAMAMRMAAEAASGKPIFSAPAHCPEHPACSGVSAAPSDTLAAFPARMPDLLIRDYSPVDRRAAVPSSPIRTRAGRGPPANPCG
jgi:hypothetical protein